uniref:Heme-binding protein soul4 n=1 Tax=Oryzias sinensis TaxID=183150 RepID=A0A8C7Y9Z2_9TELE
MLSCRHPCLRHMLSCRHPCLLRMLSCRHPCLFRMLSCRHPCLRRLLSCRHPCVPCVLLWVQMGEVQFEERVYPAGFWACVTRKEDLYEQSISMGFMKLMRFICKENSAGHYLGMTVPVVNAIRMLEDGSSFHKEVETAMFLPSSLQSSPPQASDPDIAIVHRGQIRVIARQFLGTTTEVTVGRQIRLLWENLSLDDQFHRDHYMVAVYENPGVPQRRNEIWFIRRHL